MDLDSLEVEHLLSSKQVRSTSQKDIDCVKCREGSVRLLRIHYFLIAALYAVIIAVCGAIGWQTLFECNATGAEQDYIFPCKFPADEIDP